MICFVIRIFTMPNLTLLLTPTIVQRLLWPDAQTVPSLSLIVSYEIMLCFKWKNNIQGT